MKKQQWYKFPNGKVWCVDAQAGVKGTVVVPDYEMYDNLEDLLDAISEEVTGSLVGLTDFSYTYVGGSFSKQLFV